MICRPRLYVLPLKRLLVHHQTMGSQRLALSRHAGSKRLRRDNSGRLHYPRNRQSWNDSWNGFEVVCFPPPLGHGIALLTLQDKRKDSVKEEAIANPVAKAKFKFRKKFQLMSSHHTNSLWVTDEKRIGLLDGEKSEQSCLRKSLLPTCPFYGNL